MRGPNQFGTALLGVSALPTAGVIVYSKHLRKKLSEDNLTIKEREEIVEKLKTLKIITKTGVATMFASLLINQLELTTLTKTHINKRSEKEYEDYTQSLNDLRYEINKEATANYEIVDEWIGE